MAKGAKRVSQAVAETTDAAEPVSVAPVEYPPNAIPLPVTPADLARCVENQRRALIHIITDANSPPIDGGLAMITAGLDALARVVPTLPDRKE
jgi:hypothetical protein